MSPADETVRGLVRMALEEDRAFEDRTTALLVPEGAMGLARIIARERGVVSGQECAAEAFRLMDEGAEYRETVPDGGKVDEGCEVAVVEGRLAAMISAERTALNFLGHLSGVATRTALFVEKVAGTGVRILDTRKTIPGLRALEKRAVVHGGGANHRPDLASYVLVKENHIASAGGIARLAGALGGELRGAEVEVASFEQLEALRSDPPGRIMLDNFSPDGVVEAVAIIAGWSGRRPEVEVSGGMTLERIARYAVPGVDMISVGSLTSSAGSLDLSMLIDEPGEGP